MTNYDYSELINGIHDSDKLQDSDPYIELDVVTRKFKFGEGFNKEVAITHDHRSNQLTFVCKRFIDGHDVLNCKLALIKWRNLGSLQNGVYDEDTYVIDNEEQKDRRIHPEDINLSEDEIEANQRIIFHWNIESNCTKKAGKLRFVINFADLDEDYQFKYKWNSAPCEELSVGEGLTGSPIDDWDDYWIEENRGSFVYDGSITIYNENGEVVER